MMPRLTVFTPFYYVGIILAILIAFNPMYIEYFGLSGFNLKEWTLFAVSMSHMGILVGTALLIRPPERNRAGGKIQTAGYLHTLIGFSAALLLIGIDTEQEPTL